MEIDDGEFSDDGGMTVRIERGDDLDAIPASHQHLLTSPLREWWSDPGAAARSVADRTTLSAMAKWFERISADGAPRLELYSHDEVGTQAGISFDVPGVLGATIGPPKTCPPGTAWPSDLVSFHNLVDFVDWMGPANAGGLVGADDHGPIPYEAQDGAVVLDNTWTLGWSPCGDVMYCTDDGIGGWFSHESGTVCDETDLASFLDRVFAELLADRCPEVGWRG